MTCDLKFVCVRAEEHYIFRMPDLHWILVLLDACLPKAWTPPKCCVSHWWLVPRLGKSEPYTSKVEHVLWNELFLATAFPEVCRCDAVDAPKAFKREWERESACYKTTRHQVYIWWPICNNSTKIICLSGWWCWLWYTDMMCLLTSLRRF